MTAPNDHLPPESDTSGGILVVDDHPANLRLVAAALEDMGHRLHLVATGEEALAAARSEHPELILLDLALPDGSGIELASRLRSAMAPAPAAIIAHTAHVGRAADVAATGAFDGFLAKPTDLALLAREVERCIGRKPRRLPSALPRGTRPLLVVDDDPIQRRLLAAQLAPLGFEIMSAAAGSEALALARARPPVAVVSDVLMPEIDGFALTLALRADPALAAVPVVLVSAHYDEERDAELARRLGADALVARVEGTALLSVLENVLASTPPRRAQPRAPDSVSAEHTLRLAHQVDRQHREAEKARRECEQLALRLAALTGIATALEGTAPRESVLDDLLRACMSASDATGAALYLSDLDELRVLGTAGPAQASGAAPASTSAVARDLEWPGVRRAVTRALTAGRELLALACDEGGPGVAIALESGGTTIGALVLHGPATLDPDAATFTRALATALGHALALWSARLAAERAGRRYGALLEHANDGIAILDQSGTILETSRRFDDLVGASDRTHIGSSFMRFVPPERSEGARSVMRHLDARGARIPDAEFLRADGTRAFIDMTLTRVTVGHETLDLCVARDIGERRMLEDQLHHAQRMESMGRLAGGVAHDFNNLLTAIGAAVEFLRSGLASHDPMRDDVETIAEAAERAQSLTRELLTFARRQPRDPHPVALASIVARSERLLRRVLRPTVRLDIRAEGATPAILADPAQIEQVLLNLVVNASDAMPRGGLITIETRTVGELVELVVTDEGEGIPADVQPHIFEPFFTTKRVGKGTGLGLSTVHGIVEQSGGSVRVSSVLGEGTTFVIAFPPLEEPVPVPGVPQGDDLPRGSGQTVLLVDDDDAVRAALARMITSCGYTLLQAGGGEAAITIAREHEAPLHALVCDVVMPGLAGPEAAARIRELHPEARIVLVSGFTDRAISAEPLGPGSRFVAKPVTRAALSRLLAS